MSREDIRCSFCVNDFVSFSHSEFIIDYDDDFCLLFVSVHIVNNDGFKFLFNLLMVFSLSASCLTANNFFVNNRLFKGGPYVSAFKVLF